MEASAAPPPPNSEELDEDKHWSKRCVCDPVGHLTPGPGVFHFNAMGKDKSHMSVLYYLPPPDRYDPASPPFIVLHGLKRDAHRYFDALEATGELERLGVLLLVPEFSEDLYPKKSGYNFGQASLLLCQSRHSNLGSAAILLVQHPS